MEDLSGALDSILSLRGVSYEFDQAAWPAADFPEQRQLGFLAQELAEVLPSAVSYCEPLDIHYVAYDTVIPVLVEALKEHVAEDRSRDALRDSELHALRSRVAEQEARLRALSEQIDRLVENGALGGR